ncbi:helix-turn-helix domain-containing protein [Streptomyces scopuliridis]|uniref:helix-turn-helix domain-containing protein n=1 Tax=Streptomyces scopuliridis TaxID=452529 RepID=UPI002DDBD2B7|nr:helix-turn-helix domain-containing protein [Streptomyces scopuliridis]
MTHVRHRHSERFTVVGNHLAQHSKLSLTAIGLGVHIQSLPDGARVGIKSLAAKFTEGEVAIASALRELEAFGYLCRTRERTQGGRWVTRTVAYDIPRDIAPQPRPTPKSRPTPTQITSTAPAPAPSPAPPRTSPRAAPRLVLPEPDHPDLTRHRTAAEILAGLRRHDPRLLLSARDVTRLAPAVSAWLERGIEPAAVQRTLTATLPPEADGIRHPAAFLSHRLTNLLPPPLPATPAVPRAPRVEPLHNCDRCDRAFRAAEPGFCRDCRAPADDQLSATA